METNSEIDPPKSCTAKEYYRDHRDKVMVVSKKEGQLPEGRDFFVVESVGTLGDGLLITGLFDNARRERMRTDQVRLAAEPEIASRNSPDSPDPVQS